MDEDPKPIKMRIGSRKSKLALIQTNSVIDDLKNTYTEQPIDFEVVKVTTLGDHILDKPLNDIDSKSLFTKELEDLLIEDKIDFIVHSLKDLPTVLPQDLCICAILKREDPNDALVLNQRLENLLSLKCQESNLEDSLKLIEDACDNKSLIIGTSSLRRAALLKNLKPNVQIENIRGNLNTRFAKLDDEASKYSAIVLACAGLKRAGYQDRIFRILNSTNEWYSVGQGALAVECHLSNFKALKLTSPLIDLKTTYEAIAERALMFFLEGGCSVPIGVRCRWVPSEVTSEDIISNPQIKLVLSAAMFSLDGKEVIAHTHEMILAQETTDADQMYQKYLTSIVLPTSQTTYSDEIKKHCLNSAKLGVELGQLLVASGADQLLQKIKKAKQIAYKNS